MAMPPGAGGTGGTPLSRVNGGYTVVEVVMAISVLGLGAMGVIGMQKAALYNNTNARNLAAANGIAQAWMERLRADALAWEPVLGPPATAAASDSATDTQWVNQVGQGWFAPAEVVWDTGTPTVPTLTSPAGAAVADVMGADLHAGDTTMAPAFCTQIRLTEVSQPANVHPHDGEPWRGTTGSWARSSSFWAREVGQAFNCAAGASAGNDATFDTSAEQGNYGFVYLVSAVSENQAPSF